MTPPSSATPPAPASVTTAPSTARSSTASFTDSFTYRDGLKVRVDRPSIFTPSDVAAGATPGDTAIRFTIAVSNGTNRTFNAGLVTVNVTAGSAGRHAGIVIDNGIDGDFTGSIVPGSSQTVTLGFDIPRDSAGKIDVEVQPGFDYTSEHWVGTAAGSTPSSPSDSSTPSATGAAGLSDPASVITSFYAAINSHDYRRAWDLWGGHLGQSYTQFAKGYADTVSDALTIDSVRADRVKVHLHAMHTDGSTTEYAGSYTVDNGTITRGSLHVVIGS